jgi:hypothetical protein
MTNHDAIFVIEWHHKDDPAPWRYWAMRFTERSARKWIERQATIYPRAEYRVVRYLREDPGNPLPVRTDMPAVLTAYHGGENG